MILMLRVLAAISAVAALLALGLSAMASDDMGRSREAHSLQLLTLVWLVVSIATPFIAVTISRRPGMQTLYYVPMLLIAIMAIFKLARF